MNELIPIIGWIICMVLAVATSVLGLDPSSYIAAALVIGSLRFNN